MGAEAFNEREAARKCKSNARVWARLSEEEKDIRRAKQRARG